MTRKQYRQSFYHRVVIEIDISSGVCSIHSFSFSFTTSKSSGPGLGFDASLHLNS